LSRTERRAAREARRVKIQSQFDVNQDGELSDEERVGLEFLQQHRNSRRGQRHGHGEKKAGRKHRADSTAGGSLELETDQ